MRYSPIWHARPELSTVAREGVQGATARRPAPAGRTHPAATARPRDVATRRGRARWGLDGVSVPSRDGRRDPAYTVLVAVACSMGVGPGDLVRDGLLPSAVRPTRVDARLSLSRWPLRRGTNARGCRRSGRHTPPRASRRTRQRIRRRRLPPHPACSGRPRRGATRPAACHRRPPPREKGRPRGSRRPLRAAAA